MKNAERILSSNEYGGMYIFKYFHLLYFGTELTWGFGLVLRLPLSACVSGILPFHAESWF